MITITIGSVILILRMIDHISRMDKVGPHIVINLIVVTHLRTGTLYIREFCRTVFLKFRYMGFSEQ